MVAKDLDVWVYAAAGSLDPGPLAAVTGVDREPVRTVEEAGLVGVVGSVDLGDFGEEPLRRNLEDLDWLAATVRAHNAVVDAVVRLGPAVPMRLATVYLHEEGVRALLAERGEDFRAALRRVAGRTEWGVKVCADPHALAGPEHAAEAGAGGGAPGLARHTCCGGAPNCRHGRPRSGGRRPIARLSMLRSAGSPPPACGTRRQKGSAVMTGRVDVGPLLSHD